MFPSDPVIRIQIIPYTRIPATPVGFTQRLEAKKKKVSNGVALIPSAGKMKCNLSW